MGYVEDWALITDQANDLHAKISRAIDVAARDVINEDPGTTNHANRIVWARHIRKGPTNITIEANAWINVVLDNATIAAAGNLATDNDVQFVVNGLVDDMADEHVGV